MKNTIVPMLFLTVTSSITSGHQNSIQISAGGEHTCTIDDTGVKCWGYNAYGQLGDGTTTNRLTPVSVSGITNAVDISSGDDHNCAVLSDGTIKCWGDNSNGRLGTRSFIPTISATPLTALI